MGLSDAWRGQIGRHAPKAAVAAPWLALAAIGAWWVRRRPPQTQPGLSVPAVAPPEHFEQCEPGRGRLADAPHRIPLAGWKDVLWRTGREIAHDRLTVVAGSVTFYSLLAIFPAIGVFVSLYGIFADVEAVRRQLTEFSTVFPPDVLTLIGDQMMRLASQRPASLSAAFLLSLLLSVWSANAGMKALFDGLNIAYDEVEKRNYATRSALTYVFTFLALMFMVLIAGVLVALPVGLERLGLAAYAGWLIPLRWALLFAIAASAFSLIYRYGPCRARARWRWVTWGGVAAAVLWLVGSLGYSWYVNNVAHFDVTYGSLGAVIGFMMWIWFSVMVVLIGAELNAEIEHQTALDSTTGAPQPMGARGAAMADTVGLAFRLGWRDLFQRAWTDSRRQADWAVGLLKMKRPDPAAGEPQRRRTV